MNQVQRSSVHDDVNGDWGGFINAKNSTWVILEFYGQF